MSKTPEAEARDLFFANRLWNKTPEEQAEYFADTETGYEYCYFSLIKGYLAGYQAGLAAAEEDRRRCIPAAPKEEK
jgi:hypothetical protein